MKKLIIILFIASLCFAQSFTPTLLTFNSGQVSPLLEARVEFPKYHASCRTVENMLVKSEGSAVRRPGTYYVADANDFVGTVRLIPFEISTDESYVIEAGNGYLRFYTDSGN